MKKRYQFGVAVAAVLLGGCVCTSFSEEVPEGRRQFQTIAAQLDPGGELFLVLNTGRWVDQMLKKLEAGHTGIPADDPDEQDVRAATERIRRFLNRQGMGVRGAGVSTVSNADGLHAFKMFILRDGTDSNLPFWRGLFGWQPRRLLSLDFLPADISMVKADTVELASLWSVLKNGMNDVATAETLERFNGFRSALTAWLGITPEDLLGSLRDEMMVAVRFEADTECTLSLGEGTITIPAPSFLVVVATGESVLRGVVEAHLAQQGLVFEESAVAGGSMRSVDHVFPGPFPFQPSFAAPPGFYIVGSTPKIVEDALLAYRHRNGLLSRPVFQEAFRGQSMVNNGILYINPKAAEILKQWHMSRVELTQAAIETGPVQERILKTLLTYGDAFPSCALVFQNWRHGVMLVGQTGAGGQALLSRLAAIPFRSWLRGLSWMGSEAQSELFAVPPAKSAGGE